MAEPAATAAASKAASSLMQDPQASAATSKAASSAASMLPPALAPLLDGSNPYFSAGFGLGLLGTGMALARGAGKAAMTLAQRHLLVTLEVTSKDRAYPWVLQWLNAQARGGGSTVAQHLSVDTVVQRLANGKVSTRFEFLPCPGRHVLGYRGRLLLVDRVREQQTVDLQTGQPWECVKLTAFGRERAVFEAFLAEAMEFAAQKEEQTTTIYTNWGTEWRPFGQPRRRRPLDSVVLADGVAEHIAADLREFIDATQWYVDRGIPYRRGYLLHGAPGCGKSSFVAALAGDLNYDICVLNLSEGGLTDDRLTHALSTVPPQSLILLEDVDAAFVQRDASAENRRGQSLVTFSGLLNALDGVAAGEERVLFMTTNHLDRLDPALIRPGRVDVIHEVANASPSQLRRMFLKFYPEEGARADAFVADFGGARPSMAVLQSYFMLHRHSADGACADAAAFAATLREHADASVPVHQAMSERAAEAAAAAVEQTSRGSE